MHLACEAELERLALSAKQRGVRFLAFKGHSVARTLYPHPACRPTSDFDLLIDPRQVAEVRQWLAAADYAPTDPFAGTIWLGGRLRNTGLLLMARISSRSSGLSLLAGTGR